MSSLENLFATPVFRAELGLRGGKAFLSELEAACLAISREDRAGQAWCREHGYRGYTSYASLNDLPWRDPSIAALVERLDSHVAEFARALDYDLAGRALNCDSIWINVLAPGGFHAAHIHPHAAISGTIYVAIPDGASAIRFEDPRLAMLMAAPPRRTAARRTNKTFVEIAPKPGTLLLWESFLRHDVPLNKAKENRISISFNYSQK